MSFGRQDYEYEKGHERVAVESIEKMGELLEQVDEIAASLKFYALEVDWDGKKQVFEPFGNFSNLGETYRMWRDHILHRLQQGDRVLRLSADLIEKLKALD